MGPLFTGTTFIMLQHKIYNIEVEEIHNFKNVYIKTFSALIPRVLQ